jgi:class 3 adenylate cyclase
LKVGLSYGEVRWRVPGHGGRFTFCFRGEAVAGASRAEQQAGAGGIIADRPILPWIESRCETRSVGRGHEGYVQLLPCPDRPLPPDRPSPGLDRAAQAPFVAASLLDEPPAAAFRHLCPAFVSFDEGMEDDPLDRLLAAALRHARQYGGLLGDVTIGPAGGLLPVWFGLPSGQPDDAERAAGFLQALVSDGLGPIAGGLTAGRAWTGFLGGTARAAYTAIGDVVNLAARLAAQAGRGQVWASQAVFDSLSGSHGFVTRGAQYVKGKVSPVPIYELCA